MRIRRHAVRSSEGDREYLASLRALEAGRSRRLSDRAMAFARGCLNGDLWIETASSAGRRAGRRAALSREAPKVGSVVCGWLAGGLASW